MWKSETPLTCSHCQQPMHALEDVRACAICLQVFCNRHVVVRDGVANCAACKETRRRREQGGPIPQAIADRVARLLEQDLVETTGSGHESVVQEAAARTRMFADNAARFEQQVVDDVQQCLHDTLVDTTWPACPEHPNHPLWYSDGWWSCERSGRRVAPLGRLQRAAS